MSDYAEWDETLETLSRAEGIVMLVGGPDVGKTTFCTLLANAALHAQSRVAIVDADVGQSEIGPPACVSFGRVGDVVRALADVTPAALAFVGNTSPRRHLVEHVAAVRLMADAARATEARLIIVDTTGFVTGPAAARLKQAQFSLLSPPHVVAIERRGECEALLAPLRHSERTALHRLDVPAAVVRKPPAYRAQRRAARFARHFAEAPVQNLAFDAVAMAGTWLNAGSPVAPHVRRFLSDALGVAVYHAETQPGHLGIVTGGPPVAEQWLGMIQEQFRGHMVTVMPSRRLQHLLVGLADGSGRTLDIGLIEAIDFRRREIGVLTPLRAPMAVRLLQFGILRVRPDGTELGELRPGDV